MKRYKVYIDFFVCKSTADVCFYRDYFNAYPEEGKFHEPSIKVINNNPVCVAIEFYNYEHK